MLLQQQQHTHTHAPTKHDSLWDFLFALHTVFFSLSLSIYSHQRKLNPAKAEKKLMLFYFLYFVFRLSPSRFKCQLNAKEKKIDMNVEKGGAKKSNTS